MTKRWLGTLAVVTMVGASASAYVLAQARAASPVDAAAATAPIPRTADGKPDLHGYWTNATYTPFERPAEFKDKEFFSVEEAAAFAKRANDRLINQPADAVHYDDAIWMSEKRPKGVTTLRTSIITDPPGGRMPAMNAEGQRRAAERAAARKQMGAFDSAQSRGLSERCIYWAHEGPPLLPTGYNSNLQIVQGAGEVVVIPEMMPVARIIPLDGRPHPAAAIQYLRGDSRGRWEGDTLVVETTNFTDKTAWRGSSAKLKVTERFTLVDPDTIRYQFTIDDPATWDVAWGGEYPMHRTSDRIYEYACHEGNYGIANILRAARLAEINGAQ
jgi:hypothetical protein